MVSGESRHAAQGDSICNYEIQLAVRPILDVVSQFRDWRIEVGFEPIFPATVKSMACSTVLLEIALSGFQILRGRIKRVGLLGRAATDPVGRNVIGQSAFHLTRFA